MTGNIANLIRKDFYAQWCEKYSGPYVLISLLLLSPSAPAMKFFTLIFIFLVIHIYNNNAFRLEEKYRTERFYASLPVRRKDIVLARYLGVVVLVAFHLALAYASNFIYKLAGLQKFQITPGYFAVTLIIVSLLTSLSFPFYFKYGVSKATTFLTVTVLVVSYGIIFAVGEIPDLALKLRTFSLTDTFSTSLLLTGIAVLLFIASIKISTTIYSKRDL